jgi:hypothetical protein
MAQKDVNDPFLSHQKASAFGSVWNQPKQKVEQQPPAYKKNVKKGGRSEIPLWEMLSLGMVTFFLSSLSMMIFWELYKPIPIFISCCQLMRAVYYDPEFEKRMMERAKSKNVDNVMDDLERDTILPALSGKNGAEAMKQWLRIVVTWLAVFLGAVCGMNAEEKYMSHFYALTFGREYTNVLANQDGAAFVDAGSIAFAPSSSVDPAQAVGFKEGRDYCAAPIKDSNQGRKSIAFWAIGYDCCAHRGTFECGDVGANHREGARAPPDGVFYRDTGMFMKAVKQSAAVNDLDLDADIVLLHWMKDPQGDKFHKFFVAVGAVLLGGGLFSLLAFGLSYIGTLVEYDYNKA